MIQFYVFFLNASGKVVNVTHSLPFFICCREAKCCDAVRKTNSGSAFSLTLPRYLFIIIIVMLTINPMQTRQIREINETSAPPSKG